MNNLFYNNTYLKNLLSARVFYFVLYFLIAVTISASILLAIKQGQADWQLTHKKMLKHSEPLTTEEIHLPALTSLHLFGLPTIKSTDVPTSNLHFTVSGIVNNFDLKQGKSKVYISTGSETSKIYYIGDTLPYGVKVYEINPNTVILENNGRFEKLTLQRPTLAFKGSTQFEDS